MFHLSPSDVAVAFGVSVVPCVFELALAGCVVPSVAPLVCCLLPALTPRFTDSSSRISICACLKNALFAFTILMATHVLLTVSHAFTTRPNDPLPMECDTRYRREERYSCSVTM